MRTRADLKRFVKFVWRIYRGDPNWVPPFIADEVELLSPDSVFFEHADGIVLMAERDGEPVGRIAALIDRESAEKDVGTVGYFEAIDDESVARALFERAEEWLVERGMRRARGPISPSLMLGPVGVLVDGDWGRPTIMMPYNPDYYPHLYEACGYEKGRDLYAYWGTIADAKTEGCRDRMREFEADGFRFRPAELKEFTRDVELLAGIHNRAYSAMGHYAYSPVTPNESKYIAKHFKDIIDCRVFIFVERHDKVVGACVGIPDVSEMLQKLDGRLGPIRLIRALLAKRRVDTVRLADFAVEPSEQRRHLGTTVGHYLLECAREAGYARAEYSWILEDNVPSRAATEATGGQIARTYRVYEKELG
jgi:GNAT superfamily N-acetyltransferase